MSNVMEERHWELLLRRIKDGKCTPFLGAGASYPAIPLGASIAREWSKEFGYPFGECDDLAQVAQYVAVKSDAMNPKEEFINRYVKDAKPPDFSELDEPHGVLAELPLPVYMTTNYDDFMMRALGRRNRNAKRELCCWNRLLEGEPSIFDDYTPTPDKPVVFHWHGYHGKAESLVLTEADYLDFLANVSHNRDMIPKQVQALIAGTSLLFIGYRLVDWSFRVLFRGLIANTEKSLRRVSVTVQLPPDVAKVPGSDEERVREYLEEYFDDLEIRVYWGTAREFAAELHRRWEAYPHGS
jgi:hypothetical protein